MYNLEYDSMYTLHYFLVLWHTSYRYSTAHCIHASPQQEELDPVLDPVLERRLIKKGKSYIIALADKEVDFTDTFKLFFTTRLPNPHFTPELSAKVTVVDFTVTLAGG